MDKGLDFWKSNAEEDYKKTPISVLRYIGELESAINNLRSRDDVLYCLEAAGVDNWSGYSEAMSMLGEMNE